MTAPSSKKVATTLIQVITVVLIAAIFFSLGMWQLDRAKAMKQSLTTAVQVNPVRTPLESVAAARESLPATAMNRLVQVSGHYVADFKAPNQADGDKKVSDWEVGLLQVGTHQGILVVRGLWSERLLNPDISQAMVIDIKGQLVPHQTQDHAENMDGVISRLDSSLIVSKTDLDLFDGYIVATAESHQGVELVRSRPTPEKLTSRIPGFYWQHLSYVVIWWLMAGVVLYLPFYRRRVAL
jgi:surfeit locus 1 family protein